MLLNWTPSAWTIYEHLASIKEEVILLREPWNAVTWLFVFNRYLMLAQAIWPFAVVTSHVRPLLRLSYLLANSVSSCLHAPYRCKYMSKALHVIANCFTLLQLSRDVVDRFYRDNGPTHRGPFWYAFGLRWFPSSR